MHLAVAVWDQLTSAQATLNPTNCFPLSRCSRKWKTVLHIGGVMVSMLASSAVDRGIL